MTYCKVKECRFRDTHTTKDHTCGKCYIKGHGLLECANPFMRCYLRKYYNDTIEQDKQCTIEDCKNKEYHTIDAHVCPLCNIRTDHTENNCANKCYNVKCPICRIDNTVFKISKKILGLTDKCCICMENNVTILFPSCYHCCICYDCLLKM